MKRLAQGWGALFLPCLILVVFTLLTAGWQAAIAAP